MRGESLRAGFRAGVPFAIAAGVLAISFGVVAEPVIGTAATLVMSIVVFAGAAQFGSVAVLAAGGGIVTAVIASILLNARYLTMGIALAPSLRGRWPKRAAYGEAMIDASWAMANRGGGRYDPVFMLGATLPAYPAWVAGTAIGLFAGDVIGDPADYGLDSLFPAFFLALLLGGELGSDRLARIVAVLGALLALLLIPIAPAGVPVIAASAVALLGLTRSAPPERADEAEEAEIEGDPVG